jgi:hypothetical protein
MPVWENDDEATQCAPLARRGGSQPDGAVATPERRSFADDDAATAFFSLRGTPAPPARKTSASFAFADPSDEATAFFQPPRPVVGSAIATNIAGQDAKLERSVPHRLLEPHGDAAFEQATDANVVDTTQRLRVPRGFLAQHDAISQAHPAPSAGNAPPIESAAVELPAIAPLAPWANSALSAPPTFGAGQSLPPMHASMASSASYPALNYPSGEHNALTDGIASRLVRKRSHTGWAVTAVAVVAMAALAFGVVRLQFSKGLTANTHVASAASSHLPELHEEAPPAAPQLLTQPALAPPPPQLAPAEASPSAPADTVTSATAPDRSPAPAASVVSTTAGKRHGTTASSPGPGIAGSKPKPSSLGSRELVLTPPAGHAKPTGRDSADLSASRATHQAAAASLNDSL